MGEASPSESQRQKLQNRGAQRWVLPYGCRASSLRHSLSQPPTGPITAPPTGCQAPPCRHGPQVLEGILGPGGPQHTRGQTELKTLITGYPSPAVCNILLNDFFFLCLKEVQLTLEHCSKGARGVSRHTQWEIKSRSCRSSALAWIPSASGPLNTQGQAECPRAEIRTWVDRTVQTRAAGGHLYSEMNPSAQVGAC